jgi:hypothetical protein
VIYDKIGSLGLVLVNCLSYCFRSLVILASVLVSGSDIASVLILASIVKLRTSYRNTAGRIKRFKKNEPLKKTIFIFD